ncbi:hypothetical protein ACVGWX_06855, partial [Enterobacter hormaechei]
GEAPPLIRPPEISPRQAEGRASLTGPKSPARASAAMTAAGISLSPINISDPTRKSGILCYPYFG